MKHPLAIFTAFAFTIAPAVAETSKLESGLPWIKGRHATAPICKELQKFEKEGTAGGLQNSRWHLTPTGFTDAYEASCEFVGVVVKGNTAIAQAFCVAGAESWPKTYGIFHDASSGSPILYIHTDDDEGREGEEYVACPPGK